MTKQTIKTARIGSSDLHKIPPDKIVVVDGFNVRNHDADWREHIDELKASILENGVLEPLTVFYNAEKDQIELRHGHCRLTAVQELIADGAKIEWLRCQTEGRGTGPEESVLQIAIRNDGMPLRQIELAQVYKRLINFGWTETQIAQRCGRSASHVSSLLRLAKSPEKVQRQVRDGKVSASLATQAVREHGSDAADVLEQAAARAEKEGKTRVTARHIETGPRRTKENFELLIDALQAIADGRGRARETAKRALHELALDPKARNKSSADAPHTVQAGEAGGGEKIDATPSPAEQSLDMPAFLDRSSAA